MPTIVVHIANQEPVKGEVEELSKPTDTVIILRNPRSREEKDVRWVDEGVREVIIPWWRVNYVQVIPEDEEQEDFEILYRDD